MRLKRFNDEGTRYEVYDGIRETYDGSVSMADDMMVWLKAWMEENDLTEDDLEVGG